MLKSRNGPIEVFLCPDGSSCDTSRSPVKAVDDVSSSSFLSSDDSRDSFKSKSASQYC